MRTVRRRRDEATALDQEGELIIVSHAVTNWHGRQSYNNNYLPQRMGVDSLLKNKDRRIHYFYLLAPAAKVQMCFLGEFPWVRLMPST
jgi:hypothetical protein